jgi:hypothetical protein
VAAGEGAEIYGCRPNYLAYLARMGKIWVHRVSRRDSLYDADELARLRDENEQLRADGRLGGRRPCA